MEMVDDASLNGLCLIPLPESSMESPPEQWLVQKFGGTSVGKVPLDIVNKVPGCSGVLGAKQQLQGRRYDQPVRIDRLPHLKPLPLIISTTSLLRAAQDAPAGKADQYQTLIEEVRTDHIESARQQIRSPEILARLEAEIGQECAQIVRVLAAAHTLGEITPRSVDKVMSVGEKLSCRSMAALLQDQGTASEYLDVSEIIDFPVKGSLDQAFYDQLAQRLGDIIRACPPSTVPVVTGFFGVVPGGLLENVGRGYTDLCAALVAVGLQANELQVWKEVDGIFTADPRKVPTARLLPRISPVEASELTFYGSEVIHPFTMEQVIRATIPIRIRNVMNPRGDGTTIFPEPGNEQEILSPGHDPKMFRTRSASLPLGGKGAKRPTAVTLKHNILVLNVHSNRRSLSHGFFAQIFSILDKWRLSIDLISTSEVHISMALHSEAPLYDVRGEDEYKITNRNLEGAIDELRVYGTVDIIPKMAILSLVGKQLNNMVGAAGKMFSTLGENNVNVEMISQGASEINISCVVEERDADRAINILHTNLFTFLDL